MGKHKSNILVISIVMFLGLTVSGSWADLEWITGGVPKGSPDKSGSVTVKDAPGDDTQTAVTGNQDIVVSHMTTCTKIVNQYPVDSVNFFYPNKNNQVCYFAYFLVKPSSRIHTATVEWFSPTNLRIAKFDQEFRVGFIDKLLTIQNETYQWFLVDMTIGMDRLHPEYGQTGLPKDLGLYTVHLTVDGQLVGITFFYVKQEEAKPAAPIATVAPASPAAKSESLPMSTPVSRAPLQRSTH